MKDKISAVKVACETAKTSGEISSALGEADCAKVDIVAHSMGGLVAREYIQSGNYNHDVDQIIFLGTPHKGSPEAYLQWEGGEFRPDNKYKLLAKTKFGLEALHNLYSSLFDYIKGRPISSIQELLPVFDYLKDKDTGALRAYPTNYPRNMFLEYLNNDISKLLNSGVNITNIIGDVGTNYTINIIRIASSSNPLWVNGKPDGFNGETADRGLEMGQGDGTVTTNSAILDSSVKNEMWNNVEHQRLPTETEGRIFNILTNKVASTTIFLTPVEKILSIQLQSPIDILVIAPDGKKMGKNFATNEEYDEITGAFYSGFNNNNEEYITIPNPLNGEYKIKLQGTGNGGEYGVKSVLIEESGLIEKEYRGSIKPEETKDLVLILNSNQNIINIDSIKEITPPNDQLPNLTSGRSGGSRHIEGEVLGAYTTDEISKDQKEKMIRLVSLLQELIKLYNLYLALYH